MAIEHKFLSIVNRTDTTAISTSDKDPFIPSNHTSPTIEYVNDSNNSVSYNSGTGGITISSGGFYHISFSCYLKVTGTTDRIVTIKFKKNGSTISTSTTVLESSFHDNITERTFTYFGSFSDNDTLQVTVSIGAGSDVVVSKGTTLTILGNSTSFGNAVRISGTTDQNSGVELNPFISGSQGTNYTTNTSADITVSGSVFKYTGAATKLYMAYANYLPTTSTLTGTQITFRLKKNNTTNYSNITVLVGASATNNKPYESTLTSLQSLSTNDYIEATSLPNSLPIYHIASSSFTVLDVNDEAYISIKTNQASNTILNNSPVILFKSSSYTSFTEPTQLVTTTGISYSSNTGLFTMPSDGFYYISSNMVMSSVSGSVDHLTASFALRKNASNCTDGTSIWDMVTKVDAQEDPGERTLTGIFQFAANDTVLLCANAVSTPGITSNINSSFTIFKVGSVGGGGGGPGGGTARITSFGSRSGGFSAGSFGSPTSGRTVGNGFF